MADGDAAGFSQAVLRLLADPALRQRLATEGRDRVVARYGSQRLVGDVRNLYLELLRKRGMRAPEPTAAAGTAA